MKKNISPLFGSYKVQSDVFTVPIRLSILIKNKKNKKHEKNIRR